MYSDVCGFVFGITMEKMEKIFSKEVSMKKTFVVTFLTVTLAFATGAFAVGPSDGSGGPSMPPGMGMGGPSGPGFGGPGSSGGPWGPGQRMGTFGPAFGEGPGPGQRLNLTKEQIDTMREMRDRYFQETRDMRYELAQTKLEMRKLFTDPKVDDATLLAKQKEVSSLRQKFTDKMAQMMIEGRKILTPEQIKKLDQMPMGGFGMGGMGFDMMGRGMMMGPGSGMMGPGMMHRGMGQ